MSGTTLVAGASGAVGGVLINRLLARKGVLIALSRSAPSPQLPAPHTSLTAASSVEWLRCNLFADRLPTADALLSAGPLDGLVAALSRSPDCGLRRIVALSSSSAAFKRHSSDAAERALAIRLAENESALRHLARARGVHCTILRPTLIYGGADAASLGAIASLAKRHGFIVLPRAARGLRMPIHADDLSATMLSALDGPGEEGVFDVGGGETLSFEAMVERVIAARNIRSRTFRIPNPAFLALLGLAHSLDHLRGLTASMVQRMHENLVVDDAPARRALRHAPGPFRP